MTTCTRSTSTPRPAGVGDIWDDVKAQVSQLADQVQGALTPDSWTTATSILPWAIGALFLITVMGSGKRGYR
jgi:hypothetical protein